MEKIILTGTLLGILAFLACTDAIKMGHCPSFRANNDFDYSRFLNHWYEFAAYLNPTVAVAKCQTLHLSEKVKGTISIQKSIVNTFSNLEVSVSAEAEIVGGGIFKLSPRGILGLFKGADVYVLDTDFDNFALIYTCVNMYGCGAVYDDFAWILTRERHPTEDIVNKAKAAMKKNKLSLSRLVYIDHKDCSNEI